MTSANVTNTPAKMFMRNFRESYNNVFDLSVNTNNRFVVDSLVFLSAFR